MLQATLQPLLIAMSLMTRLPISRWMAEEWSSEHYQQSVYYYPVVGLILGLLLTILLWLLPQTPLLSAAIIVAAWVALTGALHLDGLADSADAYFAAHKDGAKALLVFKDPAAGVMGVVSVVCLLLLKFTALAALGSAAAKVIIAAMIISRAAALLMMNTTAYARVDEEGMVADLVQPTASSTTWYTVAASAVAVLLLLGLVKGLLVLLGSAAVLWWWRRLWLGLIKGFTGDCLGALIELVETVVLVAFALVWLG